MGKSEVGGLRGVPGLVYSCVFRPQGTRSIDKNLDKADVTVEVLTLALVNPSPLAGIQNMGPTLNTFRLDHKAHVGPTLERCQICERHLATEHTVCHPST